MRPSVGPLRAGPQRAERPPARLSRGAEAHGQGGAARAGTRRDPSPTATPARRRDPRADDDRALRAAAVALLLVALSSLGLLHTVVRLRRDVGVP